MSRSSADKRDIYYRLCKSEGYRARSAYKLLHLDEEFDIFRGVNVACDFCAAPGSWSQVLSRKLLSRPRSSSASSSDPPPAKIISIDLQPMAPLPGLTTLLGDITKPDTLEMMLKAMDGKKAELIVCDGAPEVTGVHDLDAYLHGQLLLAALTLALPLLAPHSTLVLKIFLSPLDPTGSLLISQFSPFFLQPDQSQLPLSSSTTQSSEFISSASKGQCEIPGYDRFGRQGGIWIRKPRSSRSGSAEHFLICRNFSPDVLPVSFDLEKLDRSQSSLSLKSFGLRDDLSEEERCEEKMRKWEKVLGWTTGDLSAWDKSEVAAG